MKDSLLMKEVNEVFQEVFDDPKLIITKETDASQIKNWDSFAQINLIVSFEDKYNIKFATKEISALTCVGDMIELIKRKRVGR